VPPALRPLARAAAPLALAVGALLATGCGGADDVSRDTFRSDLQERTTIPEPVAECITDAVYDEFEQADVNDIYRAPNDAELRDAIGEDAFASLNDINQTCFTEQADAAAEGGGEG
jgi:hypothetical protein